ncbi:GNAT family N-acetyltransferase [Flavihumibacter petaseus]|uniref:Putative acetyltransferase n=1 Tax=Flavihumibacter petaseus NBRC 106054 TaxID=1220578 RepID=A0A0E9N4L3_9BACT|nr:GNAT family N-acetyltransferase [Flavihumibacter petaseus]GAO44887.1 putative acetyltransferase [Flavihumibacter petaseus NBRC 106054]
MIRHSSEDQVQLREATEDDLKILRAFEQGVIAAERPYDHTIRPDPILYYNLEYMLTAPEIRLVIAMAGGIPVGSGYARIEAADRHYLLHDRQAYLGFMYVLPEYRGRGINRLILDELSRWATENGVQELRLEVYAGNSNAIRAYEKAGFSQLLIQMRKAAR